MVPSRRGYEESEHRGEVVNLRTAIATQLDRVMKVGSVVTMALLIANLSLLLTQFFRWRGGPVAAWVLGSAIVITAIVLLFAHLWTQTFDMVRAMRRANAVHDPCQVYQIHPYERAIWLNVTIPQLEAQAAICANVGASVHASELLIVVAKMRRWETLGFIPRADYPKHLLHYYWHEEAPL